MKNRKRIFIGEWQQWCKWNFILLRFFHFFSFYFCCWIWSMWMWMWMWNVHILCNFKLFSLHVLIENGELGIRNNGIPNFLMQLCAMCEYLDKKIKCKTFTSYENKVRDWEIKRNWKWQKKPKRNRSNPYEHCESSASYSFFF